MLITRHSHHKQLLPTIMKTKEKRLIHGSYTKIKKFPGKFPPLQLSRSINIVNRILFYCCYKIFRVLINFL